MPLGILPSGLIGEVASPSKVLGLLPSGLRGEIPWGSAGALEVQAGGLVGETADPLATWHAALSNVDTEQARVLWVGDSVLEGTGASARSNRTLDLMLAEMVADYPVSGQGASQYLPAVYGCPKSGQATNTSWGGLWTTSSSGTITQRLGGIGGAAGTMANTFGLGMRSVDFSGTNATVTYTLHGTDVDVWFAAGGSFTYSVDGGAFSSAVSTAGMNANADTYPIHLGSSGSHTLAIRRSSGTIHLLGFTQFDGARDKGIAFFDACHWAAITTSFYDVGTPTAPQNAKFVRSLAVVNPQLVAINIVANEINVTTPPQFQTNYAGMLDAIKATVPSASIVMFPVYQQGAMDEVLPNGYTPQDYFDVLEALAESYGARHFVLTPPMPAVGTDGGVYYQSDEMHLKDAGHALMASVIEPYIDPAYVPPPMTLTGTLPNANVGVAYSARLTFGGTFATPVTAGLQSGSLPAWMTATADATGITYSGTPTVAASAVNFTPQATDSTTPTAQVAIGPAQSVTVDSAGVTYATWDSAGAGYGHTLSNGNLTVSCGDSDGGITTPLTSGVTTATGGRYYECTYGVIGTYSAAGWGIASFANGKVPGDVYSSPSTNVGVRNNGDVYSGQSLLGNIGLTFAAGDTVQLYIAPGGGVYVGKIGTGWVAGSDPTASDPPLFTLPTGTWRPAAGGAAPSSTGAVLTANFGATAWLGTPPAGATGWTV